MCLVTFSHLNLTFQKRKRKADEKDKKAAEIGKEILEKLIIRKTIYEYFKKEGNYD